MKKNFTLKSVFTLIAAFALAMPAWADVTSVSDLFGKYKFTADMEVTSVGQSYTEYFSNDCDVVITKCSSNIYDGEIQGLAGASGAQKINGINTSKGVLNITNPNQNYPWGSLYMSDGNGMNPYGIDSMYNDVEYAYDSETKTITMPDFTLVSMNKDFSVATVIVKFTNAKLTLVEAENVEVANISGDWHYTAGKGTWDTMEGSTLPLEWDMTLTATDDNNKTYDLSLVLGDYEPLELTAKFDGVKLTIPFDSVFFDAENRISLWDPYGGRYKGNVEFNVVTENTMTLSMMYIRQDSISPEVKGGALQYYMNGLAKKQSSSEEEEAFTWEGTYTVKGTLVDLSIEDYDYPTEFDMEVVYSEAAGIYLITQFFGNDVTGLNYGGIPLTPSADDPNKAQIATEKYLKTIVGGESYLCLMDDDVANSPLTITRLEDGTFTISNFTISYMTYDKNWNREHEFAVAYEDVTAEVKEIPFTWASTLTINTPNVTVYNEEYAFPSEFEMEVQYLEDYDIYLVTKMFGNDVTGLNYGGIRLYVSEEDPNKAELTTGGYLQTIVGGESYLCLKDAELGNSLLTLTRLEDGTIAISDFCVTLMTYNEDWSQNHEKVALYSQAPFSWANTFTIKAPYVTVYNEAYALPSEFEMEVQYFEDYGIYLVTKMFGNDVTGLNYGGIRLYPSEDDPYKAELTTGSYLKTIVGGESYLCLKDAELGNSLLTLTRLEDGTITISDFYVTYMTYNADWSQNHEKVAFYSQEATGIEDIVVENKAVEAIFDLTGRKLDAITAPGLYIVNGKKVLVK